MGKLEKRQAGAVSASVLGFMLVLSALLLSLVERGGLIALLVGGLGGCVLVAGVVVNARVSSEMIHEGRR